MFSVFLTSSLPSASLFPVNVTGEEKQMDEGQSVIGLMHALPCYFVFSDAKGCFLSTYVVTIIGTSDYYHNLGQCHEFQGFEVETL